MHFLTVAVAVACLLTSTRALPEYHPKKVGQIVKMSSGSVVGHAATKYPKVSEYLGIPYAQPPIGNLRFAAPVPYNGSTLINGSSFGASCPQSVSQPLVLTTEQQVASNITAVGIELFNLISSLDTTYSEDCLFLNIWTKPQSGEAKKAIMVYFHGGGYTGGTSSMPVYNGAALVEKQDVIVVTFNYRLSILGFPGNPSSPSNLALQDQRLAVEWVRTNIASFGGDPARITLFGQSAGAASIDYLSYAFPSDPIAAGIILQSGTAFSFGLPYPAATIAANWFLAASTLGCGNASTSSEDLMKCMRAAPISDILAAIPNTGLNAIISPFGPSIDNTLVFTNYSLQTPADIPVVVGSNNNEAGQFRTQLALQNIFFSDADWDEYTAASWTCPAALRANISSKSRIWRYRFHAVFPNTDISTEGGAYHGAELTLLFGTESRRANSTGQENRFERYIQGAWAAFAKDPLHGLGRYEGGWSRYQEGRKSLVRLGWENRSGTNEVKPEVYDGACKTASLADLYCRDFGICGL